MIIKRYKNLMIRIFDGRPVYSYRWNISKSIMTYTKGHDIIYFVSLGNIKIELKIEK